MRAFMKRFVPVLLCLLLLAQCAMAYTTLEKGDKGSDVRRMQEALNALGYTLEADGDFGTATRNAVREFQRDHGLSVDGKAGNETLTRLYELYALLGTTAPDTGSGGSDAPVTYPTARVYCADGGKLNLRSGAGTGYRMIRQIPTGENVVVYDRGSKWCYVGYDGEEGYVMTSFLRFEGDSSESAPSPEAVAAIVTCDDGGKLNLRKSANSGARVLKRIPNGTKLQVTVVNSKWCKTSYAGEVGYVMSSFLDFNVTEDQPVTPPTSESKPSDTTQATPTPAPVVPEGYEKARVTPKDGGSLNLRKKTSTSSTLLERIPFGTELYVKRVSTTWCKTTYNGDTGYVMTKFLTFDGETAPTPTPEVPDNAKYTAQVYCEDGGKLNLREGAGTGYRVLVQIPNNTKLDVIVRGTKWSQVTYKGKTGYVSNDYLIFTVVTDAPETGTPGQPETNTPGTDAVPPADPDINELPYGEYRYAIVKTENGSLNVRKGPGTDFGTVDSIKDDKQVVVKTIEGDWCSIYYGEKKGYVMRKYLVISEPTGSDSAGIQYDTSILTRTLREGYVGEDVTMVQNRLEELDYLAKSTGTYDTATINAVKNFQRLHSLTVDGKAGKNTFALLFSSGAFPYTPTLETYDTYVTDWRNTSSEERTAAILRAQKALLALNYYAPANGKFDENTHDAIVDFQLRNGVNASGILDEATQYRLFSGNARDVGWQPRESLEVGAGILAETPTGITLKHWFNEVKGMLSGVGKVTVYDPDTGLSWQLSVMSRGNHLDVQPTSLRDTLIQRKSFVTTSWDIHTVYVLLPDGSWCMATMHNRPHGSNTIINNGFGGQNCVHFLRDMSEAKKNDPDYGVDNQEALRKSWKTLTGQTITY